MSRLPVIESKKLNALPHIQHGFFTRAGGMSQGIYDSLNCGLGSADDKKSVEENRNRVVAHFEQPDLKLINGKQTHSSNVAFLTKAEGFTADGAGTNQKGLALGVLTADCAPILIADKTEPLIAAVHAGWRGAVGGIAQEAVSVLQQQGAKNLIAAIGPLISAAVYQVADDMKTTALGGDPSAEKFFTAQDQKGKFLFDLQGYLQTQLEQLGVETDSLDQCTFNEPEQFFSHRYAQQQQQTDYGRQLSVILLR